MSALLAFQFEETPIRVVMIDGDPWWVAGDLAKALDYREAYHMIRVLDDDEKGVHNVQTLGGLQEMSVISEAGMYHASFKSRKEVAVRFRKWVTGDLLPTLRRTGRYEMPGFEPPPVQALDLDPTRLSVGVSVVRTAMRLYGPAAARSLWAQVGLPPVDSEAAMDGDPLAIPLQAYLQGRMATTIAEAAEGMGLRDPDWSTRLRIGKLLGLWGWSAKNEKVTKYRTARVFRRPPSGVTIEQGIDQ
jgi:hypothetical protein